VPVATLVTLASYRFKTIDDFLESFPLFAALLCLFALPGPFLITGLRDGLIFDYASLFDEAWQAVVRISAAFVFQGVFWALLLLSSALLGLVGLDFIEDLFELDGAVPVLSGIVVGLAIAVANELSDYVSPSLVLRLLRLLLPVLAVVVAIFVAALPLRGLSGLFGNLSAAATLMGMSFVGLTLISVTLDRDAEEEAGSGTLRLSVQVMALLLAVIGLLACYAVWLRVDQYGWTPARLAAMAGAVIAALYGLAYAAAIVLRGAWSQRIRQINVAMALITVAIAALWLTPLLNPERISSNHQIARFERGEITAEALDLWTIRNDWGRAGTAAIARLSDPAHPRAGDLEPRLALLDSAASAYEFQSAVPPESLAADIETLRGMLAVTGEADALPEAFFQSVGAGRISYWIAGCERSTPGGNPGCVAVIADFLTTSPGLEVFVITMQTSRSIGVNTHGSANAGFRELRPNSLPQPIYTGLPPEVIDRIRSGAFVIGAPGINALRVRGVEIFAVP
ncbi:MAG: DUF4153 domain-containing protein, partial [Alphaproteobacteria bacterium]|nr:DUF4153 domain-containing protein [Alphaproteobacteria bacterium]